jgi:peptidoglycan/LPS O-acetylase OafA/YrhL
MRHTPLALVLALALCLVHSAPAPAQRVADTPGPADQLAPPPMHTAWAMPPGGPVALVAAADRRPLPRWVRWGLVGAGAGAVTFALLGRATIDTQPNPVLHDAALGAAAGFVIVGGSVALYDLVCAPDSAARRSGLCSGPGSRRR